MMLTFDAAQTLPTIPRQVACDRTPLHQNVRGPQDDARRASFSTLTFWVHGS
jgi:hypothetical protein